jgi:hypothetical protein
LSVKLHVKKAPYAQGRYTNPLRIPDNKFILNMLTLLLTYQQ